MNATEEKQRVLAIIEGCDGVTLDALRSFYGASDRTIAALVEEGKVRTRQVDYSTPKGMSVLLFYPVTD